jgi:hypothetical protein
MPGTPTAKHGTTMMDGASDFGSDIDDLHNQGF